MRCIDGIQNDGGSFFWKNMNGDAISFLPEFGKLIEVVPANPPLFWMTVKSVFSLNESQRCSSLYNKITALENE